MSSLGDSNGRFSMDADRECTSAGWEILDEGASRGVDMHGDFQRRGG